MQKAHRGTVLLGLVMIVLGLVGLVAAPRRAQAQTSILRDVDIAVIVQVHDVPSWSQLYRQVLGAATLPLGVSVASGTGRRTVMVQQPKFDTALLKGSTGVRVTVYGKIGGHEALAGLTDFQMAILEQSSGAWNHVVLSYGLASTNADLLELYFSRP